MSDDEDIDLTLVSSPEDLEKMMEQSDLSERDKERLRVIERTVRELPVQLRGMDVINLCANIIAAYVDSNDQVCDWCEGIHTVAHKAYGEREKMARKRGFVTNTRH